jgi:hypothetical protein
MKKESVLSQSEKDNIEIEKIIFHIIIADDFKPTYLDELTLTENQVKFFKERLIDASSGRQYKFNDTETSIVHEKCKSILDDINGNFISASKKLAASFHDHHNKNTNDGVFVVALTKIADEKLIFLVKIDHKKVYQYILKHGVHSKSAIIKEITNTFVEDKRTIQKSAIIDVTDNYKWDVIAIDRTKSDDITKYFRDFLSVYELESSRTLTKKALDSARDWAFDNFKFLPKNQDVSTFKDRAYNYLTTQTVFNSDSFAEMVTFNEDPELQKELANSLLNYLAQVGLAGQNFKIKSKLLTLNEIKNIRKTREGVKIEWEGDATRKMVDLPIERNEDDGLYHITIKTKKYEVIN